MTKTDVSDRIKIVKLSDLNKFNTWSAEFFINVDDDIRNSIENMDDNECKTILNSYKNYDAYVDRLIDNILWYKYWSSKVKYGAFLQAVRNTWKSWEELTSTIDNFRELEKHMSNIFSK